jgi:hypothetical protein
MIEGFPELQTRPELVAELQENRRLRSKLFHALNVLHNVTNLPDEDVATETLAVMSDYYWGRIKERFKPELEAKDVRLWNQLVGVYRNFVLNMRMRIKPTRRRPSKNPHYVLRAA